MRAVVMAVVKSLALVMRSRMALQIEILALRHQLVVYQRSGRRPRLQPADRFLRVWLSRTWSKWREVLVVVQPRTVISWQRQRFRDYWTRLSRGGKRGVHANATVARERARGLGIVDRR
jgi:putative transposase